MSQLLDENQLLEAYVRNWDQLQKEFFKLETLQFYEEDNPALDAFRAGDKDTAKTLMQEYLLQDPARPYDKIKERGLRFWRTHIVSFPLSDYLRFEFESYRISSKLGEKILLISTDEFSKLNIPQPRDFLLFDDRVVIVHNFEETGRWLCSEVITSSPEVSPYLAVKKQLLEKAIPLNEFLSRYE